MSSPVFQRRVYRFGVFEADVASGELRKNGMKLRIQEQPFQILAMLLERQGEVVSREELRQKLWSSETYGDFNHGLNNAINRLREALGDSAESPRFIQTVPRRGYRLITSVQVNAPALQLVPAPATQTASPEPAHTNLQANVSLAAVEARPEGGFTRWRLPIVAATILVLVGISVTLVIDRRNGAATAQRIHSLVVLPLEDVSGDPAQAYFADGMTDALITELAQLGPLRVISRTSAMHYRGSRQSLPQIARELDVDAVVEGTVARAGDRVRLNAQLIEARTDKHLWAATYERDLRDVLRLQAEMAKAIADQVLAHADLEHLPQRTKRQVNPQAYDAYLRGQAMLVGSDNANLEKARDYFTAAIKLDPTDAQAYAFLAETYGMQHNETARVLAARALELDENCVEAHTVMAMFKHVQERDFAGSELEFQRALQLDPNFVHARNWHGVVLGQMGKVDDAVQELTHAKQLDPKSIETAGDLALVLYFARRYDEAVAETEKVLAANSTNQYAHRLLLRIYAASGQIHQYIAEYANAPEWFDESREGAQSQARELQVAYETGGVEAFWRKKEQLERARPNAPNMEQARALVHLGQNDRALAILESLFDRRPEELVIWINADPEFDNLRPDPRFQALLKRLGFAT